MIANKKVSIILVLKVLEEYSDENHFLTHQQIIDKIDELYDLQLERKSIANSLSLLEELEYDIVKNPKGGGGVALYSRTFEKSEVTFLVDAIFSSKSISGTQAQKLTKKISSGLSRYDRKSYDYLDKSTEVSRTSNKDVFYNIDIINEAMKNGKWIGFKYIEFDDDGKERYRFHNYVYHRSPCYLINNFGRYYLLGYGYKHNDVAAYRVDYMKEIYIMDERQRIDPMTLDEFKNYKSLSEYLNDHIYMFGGKPVNFTIQLQGPHAIQYIDDWFGKNAEIYKDKDGLKAKIRCGELAFFYWAMQYGEHIHILSPKSMVDKVKNAAEQILEQYK